MKKNTVPLCYYPTRVVLLDDNEDFLKTLEKGLVERGINCISFTNPIKALDFVSNTLQRNRFSSAIQTDEDENTYMNSISQIKFDIRTIYNEIFNPHRFMDISVTVIDYDMPIMRGDEFCIALANTYLKKLMLTGQVDYPTAVSLLNHNIIDNYTEKSATNSIQAIYREICSLQTSYFCDLTKSIIDNIFDSEIIYTDVYVKLVNDIIQSNAIIEHYTVSKNGSKLFLDKNGLQLWLIIATEDDLNGWYETAELADAPNDITTSLLKKSRLVFLFDDTDTNVSPRCWGNFLYAANEMNCNDFTFYYSIISEQKILRLD